MIVSMTGFGDATAQRGGTHYAVEIRSLNNRYFKSVIKLPESISGLEPGGELRRIADLDGRVYGVPPAGLVLTTACMVAAKPQPAAQPMPQMPEM